MPNLRQIQDHADEEALAKEMYAHFGLAMKDAQVFEKRIRDLATSFTLHGALLTGGKETQNEITQHFEKASLSRLIQKLQTHVKITEEFSSKLQEARKIRNELAHNYFAKRVDLAETTEGKREMTEELKRFQILFWNVDHNLEPIVTFILRKFGLNKTRLELFTEEEELKNEAQDSV